MSDQRFLLIQLRQLGDILLTTPCAEAIKKNLQNASVSFLCHQMGIPLLKNNPYIDKVFTYKEDMTWNEHAALIRSLREHKFTTAIDFMNNPRSAFLGLASKAPQRVSFTSIRQLLYTKVVSKPDAMNSYIVNQKFSLLKSIDINEEPELVKLYLTDEDRQVARDFAYVHKDKWLEGHERIAIAPTHRRAIRRWPIENYVKLARRLTIEKKALVVWLWGPGEEGIIEEIMRLCECPTYKAPKTNLRECAALIELCDFFIGNSNGPSHLAVAVNTPSLQLHGPTFGRSWCPDSPNHKFIQAPENEHGESDLTFLSVDEVFASC